MVMVLHYLRLNRYILFSLVVGLCGVISYGSHFLGLWSRSLPEQVWIIGYLWVLISGCAYWLLRIVVYPGLRSYSQRAKVLWLLGAILIGGCLLIVIPVRKPAIPIPVVLEIVATGEKNPVAKGSEVRVEGIKRTGGEPIPLSEIDLDEGWEIRNGLPVSYQLQPATLRWKGAVERRLKVSFISNPRSGIVLVRLNGEEKRIDLYSQNSSGKTLTLRPSSPAQLPVYSLLRGGINIADSVILGILVLLVAVWLVTRPGFGVEQIKVSRWTWLGYVLPCVFCWSVCLLAIWPGMMSSDSIDQWGQMLNGQYNDVHPAFHTLTNWLITRIWISPAIIAIVQIIALAFVAGWGLTTIRKIGAPLWAVMTACGILAISPVNGLMAITLWKDIPYSIVFLAFTILTLITVVEPNKWQVWLLMGIIGSLVALYRHNGLVPAIGTLAILLVTNRKYWPKPGVAFLITLGVYFGIRGPIYDAVGVRKANWVRLQPLIHQVAAHVSRGTLLDEEETIYLDKIHPLLDKWKYNCSLLDFTLYDGKFHTGVISEDPERFVWLWLNLLWRNPKVNLGHIQCSSSLVWRVTQPPDQLLRTTAMYIGKRQEIFTIAENLNGLLPSSYLPPVKDALAQFVSRTQLYEYSWLVWRPALYLYISLSAIIISAFKLRNLRILFVALPVLLHSILLFFINIAPDFRFQYPIYLVGLWIWPLITLSSEK